MFVLCPHSWHIPPKTLNFLSEENSKDGFCYVNEVTFRKHLRGRGWLTGEPTT